MVVLLFTASLHSMAERTGSLVFIVLWLYVLDSLWEKVYNNLLPELTSKQSRSLLRFSSVSRIERSPRGPPTPRHVIVGKTEHLGIIRRKIIPFYRRGEPCPIYTTYTRVIVRI